MGSIVVIGIIFNVDIDIEKKILSSPLIVKHSLLQTELSLFHCVINICVTNNKVLIFIVTTVVASVVVHCYCCNGQGRHFRNYCEDVGGVLMICFT